MSTKIEKNIPIPIKSKPGYDKCATWRLVISKMKIGDSFVVTKKEYFDFHNATRFDSSLKKFKFTSRSIDADTKRVWRIK